MYRCFRCDYEGNKPSFNEGTQEYQCPLCDSECYEFEEMTEEQNQHIADFFSNKHKKFIIKDIYKNISEAKLSVSNLIWNDITEINELLDAGNSFYIYTLTEREEQTWIEKGYQSSDKLGYFFVTEKIDIPAAGIRLY